MVSAGARILPVDVRRSLAHNSRNTQLGAAVGATETTLAIDVSFTLTAQRRVLIEVWAQLILTSVGTSSYAYCRLRSNTTGSAIAKTDTFRNEVVQTVWAGDHRPYWQGLLAAGTYAFGLLLIQGSTTINVQGPTGGSGITCALDAWDMGDA